MKVTCTRIIFHLCVGVKPSDDITMKCISFVSVVIACATFFCVGTLILMVVSKYQPEPYMDELFHIRQAQKYCSGHYSEVKKHRYSDIFECLNLRYILKRRQHHVHCMRLPEACNAQDGA